MRVREKVSEGEGEGRVLVRVMKRVREGEDKGGIRFSLPASPLPDFDLPTTHYLSIFQLSLLPRPPPLLPLQYPLSPSPPRLLHYPSTILYISSSLRAYQSLPPPHPAPIFFIFEFSSFPHSRPLSLYLCPFFPFHNGLLALLAPPPSSISLNLQSRPFFPPPLHPAPVVVPPAALTAGGQQRLSDDRVLGDK